MNLPPLLLQPVYVSRTWGCPELLRDFHPDVPLDGAVGESWDISSYLGADCLMRTGPMAGRPLSALLAEAGGAILGRPWAGFADFPLLQKFLAPKANLPLQVHPADGYARRVEGQNGKTECWYILDCPEDAAIWLGLRHVRDREDLERIVGERRLQRFMQRVPVRRGDVVYIPSGLLHGLGKGCVAYEVQQNSDVTYRLDDFGLGVDTAAQRREQVRKALDVVDFPANLARMGVAANWLDRDGFLDCAPYFGLGTVHVAGDGQALPHDGFCRGLTVLSGAGELLADGARHPLGKGQSWLLPAGVKDCVLRGSLQVMYSLFPQ